MKLDHNWPSSAVDKDETFVDRANRKLRRSATDGEEEHERVGEAGGRFIARSAESATVAAWRRPGRVSSWKSADERRSAGARFVFRAFHEGESSHKHMLRALMKLLS